MDHAEIHNGDSGRPLVRFLDTQAQAAYTLDPHADAASDVLSGRQPGTIWRPKTCGGQVITDTSIGGLSCRFMLEGIG